MENEKKRPPYEEAPYEVGFGKPPKAHQFQKGQSGNPKGRPPSKSKNVDHISVADVLNEPMKVRTKDGREREMSPFEVGLRKLAQQALKKKLSEIREFLNICEVYRLLKAEPEPGGGVIFIPKGISLEDWQRSQSDPTFKPVPKDYDALVKKHCPSAYESYKQRMAEQQAEAERRAKEEAETRKLLSKKTGGRNKKTIVREVALERHQVTEGGKTRTRTTLELVLLTLRNMAAEGHGRALRELIKMDERANPVDPPKGGVLVVPQDLDPMEYIAEALEYNLTCKPPPGLRAQYGYPEDDEEDQGI